MAHIAAQANDDPQYSSMLGVAIEPTYFDLEHHDVDAAGIVRIVRDLGANTIRVGMFSHQGHAYYRSQFAPQAPFLKRDLLDDFAGECRKQSIRLAIYINSKWVTDLYEEHPDWGIRLADGPMVHESESATLQIHPMCPCSPFMDNFIPIVKEIAARGRPDLVYIDNFGIQPFCECSYCHERFGEAIPSAEPWDSIKTQRYLQWVATESRAVAGKIVAAARTDDSKMPVVFNRGGFWSTSEVFSPQDNAIYCHTIANGIHTESAVRFYGQSFEHINEQCAFGRSIGLPAWTWVEYPMLPFSYVAPSAAEAKIKAAKVIANGGRPMLWSMPCAPPVNPRGMPGVRDVYDLVSRNADVLDDARFDRFLGIVYSTRSVKAYCRGSSDRLKQYKRTFAGAHELAIRNHMPCEFVLDEQIAQEQLEGYAAIVLPNTICLSKQQCEGLGKYVFGGGGLIATYETSLYDPLGRRHEDFMLHDLFGAGYRGELGEQFAEYSAGYCRFVADHAIAGGGLRDQVFPLAGKYLAVESEHAVAKLLARCRYYCDYPQPQTEHPAIVAREYGKGRVVYISGEFFSTYHDKGLLEYSELFRQCMQWFARGRLAIDTDLPDTVELTMATARDGRGVIHLVNCTFDKTRPIDEIIPVTDRYLRIRTAKAPTQVVDITTGAVVPTTCAGDHLRIELPALTGYNVLIVES